MIEKLNRMLLLAELAADEGMRLKTYRCTAGKLTIGVGRNLDDVGLLKEELAMGWTVAGFIKNGCTKEQALHMLDNDVERVEADLDRKLPWWRTLDPIRQRVIVNMCFNLGIGGLLGFKNTLAHVKAGQYQLARFGMLTSLWAKQVGKRAHRLADLMYLPKA